MTPEEYNAFTQELLDNVSRDADVLGLVAVGSMAAQDYLPDRWSDHDFFLLVKSGEQARFRSDLCWLPRHAEIVLSFQETLHGLKVVYEDSHMLEFAVFDLEELNLAGVNRYRVLLDREKVEQRVKDLQTTTTLRTQAGNNSDEFLFKMFLCNLLVGVWRYRRGERLSGHQFVKVHALTHLIKLLTKYQPSPQKGLLDNLDPTRRFEKAYPELGQTLDNLLLLETPRAATAMLDLAETTLAGHLDDYPVKAVEVVRRELL
ncbi:MAG TPA: hypothetical protein VH186_10615 [Chloroflexia bacterium]|nr:hypothetical protein [Chloroflexia bacterium]